MYHGASFLKYMPDFWQRGSHKSWIRKGVSGMVAPLEANVQVEKNLSQWHLIGSLEPHLPPQQFPIYGGKFVVGRRPDLQLSLPRASVSKIHAELLNVDHALFVRDLQSTNGTYVNGCRIGQETPIAEGDIVQFADVEFRVGCAHQPSVSQTITCSAGDWPLALGLVRQMLREKQVIPYFQPIISFATQKTVGYEVLARSDITGLKSPREMFQAAALLGLEQRLSELSREVGVLAGARFDPPTRLFLNTHPSEHDGHGLVESLEKLRVLQPHLQLVLELHEGAITDLGQMRELRSELRRLDIQLAFDDFGAGQSRLVELTEIAPEIVKFDIGLIRDIHESVPRQQLLAGLLKFLRELKIAGLAEGIERPEEARVCRDLGFELAQGYLYAKPAPLADLLPAHRAQTRLRTNP